MIEDFQSILQHHIAQMSQNIVDLSNGLAPLTLPIVPKTILTNLIKTAQNIFEKEPVVLKIPQTETVFIIGDLHGHLIDLYRILVTCDLPPHSNYLFLGDIIDRGPFNTETITLIFILKVLFPTNIYIIRGNHEFASLSRNCGFKKELDEIYTPQVSEEVFTCFMSCFSYLPLLALVGPKILCAHAGISPSFTSLNDLNSGGSNDFPIRPISEYKNNDFLNGILWSDPNIDVLTYLKSPRGTGYLFGDLPFKQFMKTNGLQLFVRGHEVVDGIKTMFNGMLMTVFSASSYIGLNHNQAAVLQITFHKNNNRNDSFAFHSNPILLPPLSFLMREDATFERYTSACALQNRQYSILSKSSITFAFDKQDCANHDNDENDNENELGEFAAVARKSKKIPRNKSESDRITGSSSNVNNFSRILMKGGHAVANIRNEFCKSMPSNVKLESFNESPLSPSPQLQQTHQPLVHQPLMQQSIMQQSIIQQPIIQQPIIQQTIVQQTSCLRKRMIMPIRQSILSVKTIPA